MSISQVGIIGMGWVGSSVAISLLHNGISDRLLVSDLNMAVAEGEAMDLNHGSSFLPSAETIACTISEMKHCDAIVITAGRGGRPGETRLDLLKENIRTAQDISIQLKGYKGLLIIVSNPVDVLTYYYQKFTGLPKERVIGTGTMLDTARLREVIGRKIKINAKSVHAHVIGEHGDSEVVLWSSATIGSMPIVKWVGWKEAYKAEISEKVRKAAQEIIKRKGATNHAIGLVTATLLKWLLRGDRRIITISSVLNGEYGINDCALSVPTLIGINGIEQIIKVDLTKDEYDALQTSASVLKSAIESVRV